MKLNLILDLSYILYKNVYTLKKFSRIEEDLSALLMDETKDIIKQFPFDNKYLISDIKKSSWRRFVYSDYKIKREREQDIDWDFVFNTFNEFKEKITNEIRHIKLIEIDGLESDDIISYIVKTSNEKGYSNLLISSDKDLNQLLIYDLNKEFINIQWNHMLSNEIVYLPENYQLFIDKLSKRTNNDIFNLDNTNDFLEFFNNLIIKNKVSIVNSEQSIFCKIVSGDYSDNIPSIVHVKNGKIDSKGKGIGKDGAINIYKVYKEIYPEHIDINSDEFVEKLADVVIYYKKINDANAKEILKKNIIFNRSLVVLDYKYMPLPIYENMVNYIKKVEEKKITPIYDNIENIENDLLDKDIMLKENNNNDDEHIPEQFRKKPSGEKFEIDPFMEL